MSYYIPAVELIRILFAPTDIMASLVMCPGAINGIYNPILPGKYNTLNIEFNKFAPHQIYIDDGGYNNFVKLFAWMAASPIGRQTYDSIHSRSKSDFTSLNLPNISINVCGFGIRRGRNILILRMFWATSDDLSSHYYILNSSHPRRKSGKLIQIWKHTDRNGI